MISIGGYEVTPANTLVARRLTMLLWGKSGSGKTELATTVMGTKLWLNFDANGAAALMGRDGIEIVDLSGARDAVVEEFKGENTILMRDLEKLLVNHPEFETVVFDSLTTFADKALTHGVAYAAAHPRGKEKATLENPGLAGYGNKYVWMRTAIQHMLDLTGRYNRNMVFIAHEDTPTKDREGNVASYDILLGSSLSQVAPINLAECWHVTDVGDKVPRRIAVRPARLRSPMKTLMFDTSTASEFSWIYNPATGVQGIKDWYKIWQENGHRKIPLPK